MSKESQSQGKSRTRPGQPARLATSYRWKVVYEVPGADLAMEIGAGGASQEEQWNRCFLPLLTGLADSCWMHFC